MPWVEYKVDRVELGDRERHQVCMGDPRKQGCTNTCHHVPQVPGSIKNPHNNINFRYVKLCDLDVPREKWLNYLQTVETLILWHLPLK